MMNFQQIKDLFEDAGFRPRSYSGRGMYGERCLSVNVDRYTSSAAVVAKVLETALSDADANTDDHAGLSRAVADLGELAQELASASEDSMGLGSVVYWPDLRWEDSDDEEDDEEEDEEA